MIEETGCSFQLFPPGMKKIFSVLLFSCSFVLLLFLPLADFEQAVPLYLEGIGGSLSYAGISFFAAFVIHLLTYSFQPAGDFEWKCAWLFRAGGNA